MLFSLGLALICALLGAAPLLLNRRFIGASIWFVIYLFLGWFGIYTAIPSGVYPLFGAIGIFTLIWLVMSAAVDTIAFNIYDYDNYSHYRRHQREIVFPWALLPAILLVLIYGIIIFLNSGIMNSKGYASLAGEMEERVWTQDIQPKDPKHILMGSVENALYQADKALGQAGSIGSQFQVATGYVTLQRINDQMWYVVPLDYRGLSVWYSASGGVPAYIKVSAEDPNRQPILVSLEGDQEMKFTPGAFFANNLERHLRFNGYFKKGIYEFLFEVDEDGNPWWVAPIFRPKYGWWGEVITEVAIISPSSGEIKKIELDEIPVWMDRVFPSQLAQDYQDWRGCYHSGWLNSWLWSKDITEAQEPILIYGADNEPNLVSGITSDNEADNSMIALVYTDARLGKSVRYEVKGGATEEAVVEAVNNNEQVSYKRLHGVNPQLYNIYGTMASVVPLLNDSHIFQGVAIVDVNNTSQIAIGGDQYEALRHYQRLFSQNGQQVALNNTHNIKTIEAKVARFGFDQTGDVYYLLLDGWPHLFTLDATDRPKLPLTKEGDIVRLEYDDSGESVMPAVSFDNLSIKLEKTGDEEQVKNQADTLRKSEEVRNSAVTNRQKIQEMVEDMTPDQLQDLQRQIKTDTP